ncbi:hypothetical protein [Helicobacter sp. MIT 99-5507]|uniref:hypothetical protein n=1 Tax=Helicobacter sp. MIT 99-5507 TaxID=152489 RepID=UPI000E1F07C7|nr:hypothetical protein [Helicobacter sp. MIT 99-5507]RDU58147.1 hypothetical protein CQA42_04405 [Helicobacter sp. MIT 99-5507]
MRFIALLLLINYYIYATPVNKCISIDKFSDDQKEIVAYAYNYGKKYNLGFTLAAIAWHESCAGEYRMNFADPSAGIYHALIPGVIKRYQMLKDTGFNRNVIGELLIRDDEFASKVAIDELLFWDKVRNGNWKDIIKSYNKGYLWEKSDKYNEIAENYYNNIKLKKEILEKYIPKYLKDFKLKERDPMLSNFNSNNSNIITKKQEKEVIEKIRKIEIAILKNDSEQSIKQAKKDKKAIISIYNKDEGDSIIHEKTITLQPFYTTK